MANLKLKSIQKLDEWNKKELRKLRITLRNRIESLKSQSKPKLLSDNHPLKGLEVNECNILLENVIKTEKLSKKVTD